MITDVVYAMGGASGDSGGAEQGSGAALLSSLLPLILIFVIFYFLLIRPQAKRAKEHKKMLENLKKGDKIITAGGIYGIIESIDQKTAVVKIAENVKIKVSRNTIAGQRTDE